MSAHTKGPWIVDDNEGFGVLKIWAGCAPSGNSAIPGQIIAVIDETARECDANARLISAAPELLEALVDVMFRHVPFSNKEAYAEKARAAILKATGEQA